MANVLESGEVRRFHAAPSVPAQTVGHHAWGVAVLASFIKTDPRPDLLMHALCHDMAELVTGDVPFTAKRSCPLLNSALEVLEADAYARSLFHLPRVTAAEKVVLKLADMLEGLRWVALYETPQLRTRVPVVFCRWYEALRTLLSDSGSMVKLNSGERERAYALFRHFSNGATVAGEPPLPLTHQAFALACGFMLPEDAPPQTTNTDVQAPVD